MKVRGLLSVAMLLVSGVLAGSVQPPKGFAALFNGKNLSGWWGLGTEDPAEWMALPAEELEAKKQKSLKDINKHWRVKGGVLVNDGRGLYLTTDKNYADFELMLEYKTVPLADSGVYLRAIPQVQIWDSTENAKFKLGADKGSGGLWNNQSNQAGKNPLVLADKPFGEWNRMHIIMVGERVSVTLNGKRVVDHAQMNNYFNPGQPIPRTGPIQLQTHGGKIGWRNIFVREIPPEEANKMLASKIGKGFKPVFDGKSFGDWRGATGSYEIIDGAIQCKRGTGGTLFTEKEYSDFAVALEFKVPEGGNNGLAIRYPGQGDPAYVGMCELQVLDNSSPKYANLNDYQFHGSAYGKVAAHRGFLRPVGEWNFQRVEVVGATIKVELNGTVILDTDLSSRADDKVKKSTKGHFGFAGHSDPVAFRNITIKEL